MTHCGSQKKRQRPLHQRDADYPNLAQLPMSMLRCQSITYLHRTPEQKDSEPKRACTQANINYKEASIESEDSEPASNDEDQNTEDTPVGEDKENNEADNTESEDAEKEKPVATVAPPKKETKKSSAPPSVTQCSTPKVYTTDSLSGSCYSDHYESYGGYGYFDFYSKLSDNIVYRREYKAYFELTNALGAPVSQIHEGWVYGNVPPLDFQPSLFSGMESAFDAVFPFF